MSEQSTPPMPSEDNKDSPARSSGGGRSLLELLFEAAQIGEQGSRAGGSSQPKTGEAGLEFKRINDKLDNKQMPTSTDSGQVADDGLLDEARAVEDYKLNTATLEEIMMSGESPVIKRNRSNNSISEDAPILAAKMGLLGGALDSDDNTTDEEEDAAAFSVEDLDAALFDEAVGGEAPEVVFDYEKTAAAEDEALDLLVGILAMVDANETATRMKQTPPHTVPATATYVKQLYGTPHTLTQMTKGGRAFTPTTSEIVTKMTEQAKVETKDSKPLAVMANYVRNPNAQNLQTLLTHSWGDVRNNKQYIATLMEKAKGTDSVKIVNALQALCAPAELAARFREGSRAAMTMKSVRAVSASRQVKGLLDKNPELAVKLANRLKDLNLLGGTPAGATLKEKLSATNAARTASAAAEKAANATLSKILSSDEFKKIAGKADQSKFKAIQEEAKKNLAAEMGQIAAGAVKRTKKEMIKQMGNEATAADKKVVRDSKIDPKDALAHSDKILKCAMKVGDKMPLSSSKVMDANARMRTRSAAIGAAATARTGVDMKQSVNSFLKEKTGEHSVHMKDVEVPNINIPSPGASQTIIKWAREMLYDTEDRVVWNEQTGVFELRTTLNGPSGGGYNRQATYRGEYRRMHDLDMALVQPTRIRWAESGERVDEMPLEDLDDLMRAHVIDTRLGMGAVQGPLGIERAEAERLGQMLDQFRTRYSFKSVFLVAFLILDQLVVAERLGAAVECGRAVDNAIIRIAKRPGGNEDTLYQQLHAALSADRIFIDTINVDRVMLKCMQMIAAGPQNVFINGQENRLIHVAQTFVTDPILWALFTEDTSALVTANAVTANNMLAFIHMFASVNNVNDDMMRGYLEAQLMLNNQIYNMGDTKPAVLITSTFETREILIPKSKPHNPLWKMIGREPARPTVTLYQDEIPELQAMDTRELGAVGALYAANLSIGFSSFFQENNLSGVDICHVRGVDAQRARAGRFLERLVHNEGGKAPIFAFAANIAGQITGTVVQNEVFGKRDWCANFVHFPGQLGPADLWGGAYGETIPSINHPFCVAFGFRCWLNHWGVSSPGVDLNLKQEVEMIGHHAGYRGWDANMGSREYETTLLSPLPNKYVDYGAAVMNNLAQHMHQAIEWRIRFQVYKRYVPRVRLMANLNDEVYQPLWDREMMMIIPYTLKTYSWEHDAQLIPFVTQQEMGNAMYHQIAGADVNNSPWAGVILPRAQRNVPLPNNYITATGVEASALGGQYARQGELRSEN